MSSFVILSPARAGSTSLRETLDSLSGVVCHGEIFAPARILGISRKIDAKDITKNVRKLEKTSFYNQLLNPSGFDFCGVKILYHQFLAPVNCYYVNRLLSGRPKVVFLWRRNLLKRLQSELLLRVRVGNYSLHDYQNLSEADIIADCLYQMEMAAWIMKTLSLHGIENIFHVGFEDLISPQYPLKNMLNFLEIHGENVPASIGKDARSKNDARSRSEKPEPSGAFSSSRVQRYDDVDLHDATSHFYSV